MSDQAAAGVEAVLKKAREQRFVLGEGDHAVANVARRQDAVFAAEAAGASAVIGDRDDGGEIGDGALAIRGAVGAARDVFLEATEERGQARAAAESDDAREAADLRTVRFIGGRKSTTQSARRA